MSTESNRFQIRARRDYVQVRQTAAFAQALDGDSSEAACESVLFLAQSLGYCRLWGVDLGDLDGSLPLLLVPGLMDRLTERIAELTQKLTDFEIRMELALTQEEQELFASDILRQRMDAWACWTAINERINMVLEDAPNQAIELLEKQEQLAVALDQWDIDLQARADLLAAALSTYLLENWGDCLVEPYALAPPWWLDQNFWDEVLNRPIENAIPSAPVTITAQIAETTPTPSQLLPSYQFGEAWSLSEPLAMAAADEEAAAQHIEFQSSANQETAAIARVKIPTFLDAQGLIAIDIRFSYIRRDPTSVKLGSIVSLGLDANGVVICDYLEGQPPIYRTFIKLDREQVKRLDLMHFVRLTVDHRDWIPKPSAT